MNIDKNVISNDWLAVLVALFLFLYGFRLSRVGLPGYLRNLFNNNIFRIVFLSLLLIYGFETSPHAAILIALVYVITLYYIGEQEVRENIDYFESFRNQL